MFVKTMQGYLAVSAIKDFWIMPPSTKDGHHTILATLTNSAGISIIDDEDGETIPEIVDIAPACCREHAEQYLDRLVANIAVGRPPEPISVINDLPAHAN